MNNDAEQGYTLIADVALIHDRKALLVKNKDPEAYDDQSGWFLPDSSIKYLEHPDKAAHRLLKEQLGLETPTRFRSHRVLSWERRILALSFSLQGYFGRGP